MCGTFDNLGLREVRLLDEASRLGRVHVLLRGDQSALALFGAAPRYSEPERLYLLEALRYVYSCTPVKGELPTETFPDVEGLRPDAWVVAESEATPAMRRFCRSRGLTLVPVAGHLLQHPCEDDSPFHPVSPGRRRVIVTGCFDWLHSGHVRFFEEAAGFGELIVAVGHDANIRLLKGGDRPLFPQQIRRYMAGAVRHVTRAIVTTGLGWVDAAPEIERFRPDVYVVNEDGDNEEKRRFCRARGLDYLVLRRVPREGLPARSSSALRRTARAD